jgi:hypothetical protein
MDGTFLIILSRGRDLWQDQFLRRPPPQQAQPQVGHAAESIAGQDAELGYSGVYWMTSSQAACTHDGQRTCLRAFLPLFFGKPYLHADLEAVEAWM